MIATTNTSAIQPSTISSSLPPIQEEERRNAPRIRRKIKAVLKGISDGLSLPCVTEDLSAGGVSLVLPATNAPCVGQRYELTLGDAENRHGSFLDDTCYATVVRTTRRVTDDHPVVLLGLRFDQPVFF